MLNHVDLKKGVQFVWNSQPYQVLESNLNFQGRGGSCMQVKIKNLQTGNVLSQNFKPSDVFEEADIEKKPLLFVYASKAKFVFCNPGNKAERIELKEEQIGNSSKFLKTDTEIEGISFWGQIINIVLPIKINLKVVEAPPALRAGRAEAGTKQVVLETGASINVPIFINEGDVLEINTETEEYVRRVE